MMSRKNFYDYDDLILCGKGELFGNGNAHLPSPPMLMFDRIANIETYDENSKGLIVAEFDIKPDLWFFDCHFQNDPVMPGCLGLDAMWQLIGFFLAWIGETGKGRALGCLSHIKFSGEVTPDSKQLIYRVNINRIVKRKFVMGIADATMECDGKAIYHAKDLKVGLFQEDK